MKHEYCSYCMNEQNVKEYYLKCVNPSCGKVFQVKGLTDQSYYECPKCKKVSMMRWCPCCNRQSHMLTQDDIVISLVGAVNSGKTTYLASLINEVLYTWSSKYKIVAQYNGCSMINNFLDKINNKLCLEPTMLTTTEPITIKLVIQAGKKLKRTFVNIFDAAGEGWIDEKQIQVNQNRLMRSSAIMFFVSPNNFESNYLSNSAEEALGSLINYMRGVHKVKQVKKIRIPIAIVCSKLDQIQSHNIISEKYAEIGDCITKERKLDLMCCKEINDLIKPVLENLSPRFLGICNYNFENYQLFGVSAIDPNDKCDSISRNYVSFRIEDPFLWILHQSGFIK